MTTRLGVVVCSLLVLQPASFAHELGSYDELKRELATQDDALRRPSGPERLAGLEKRLLARIDRLFTYWQGSRWGLGLPQSTQPHVGKTNCGLFVAVILRDAGFRLPIWKFNRQASYHAIASVAPRRARRYFYRAPMERFLAEVRRMGPGLYLIGLDIHIGFLRVRAGDDDVRFIHSSYVTHTVVDEDAATAGPIVNSRYRMVGKILQAELLRAWLERRPIEVLGNL